MNIFRRFGIHGRQHKFKVGQRVHRKRYSRGKNFTEYLVAGIKVQKLWGIPVSFKYKVLKSELLDGKDPRSDYLAENWNIYTSEVTEHELRHFQRQYDRRYPKLSKQKRKWITHEIIGQYHQPTTIKEAEAVVTNIRS